MNSTWIITIQNTGERIKEVFIEKEKGKKFWENTQDFNREKNQHA